MSFIAMKPILDAAYKNKIAFGAFNINSPGEAQAAIKIHEIYRSAAILQVIEFANGFMSGVKDYQNATLNEKIIGAKRIAQAVKGYADKSSIPVALHLDHGSDPEFVKACVDCGYTSVMIDGSHLPFEENIKVTKGIADYAHAKGVTVEGELGILGGREDKTGSNITLYTNPNEVCEFFNRTGVDCLAISYGTSHGPAKGKGVVIRKEIAIAASENMRYAGIEKCLVSHGSSTVPEYIVKEINSLGGNLVNVNGIPIEQILEVIPCGIGKINVGTDLRLSILRYVREYFSKNQNKKEIAPLSKIWEMLSLNPKLIDERVYFYPIIDNIISANSDNNDVNDLMGEMEKGVMEIVGQLIVRFGQTGSAGKVECKNLDNMKLYYKSIS